MITIRRAGLFATLVVLSAGTAAAQVLGTFPWQMQPYCNVIRMTLTTTPTGFGLEGTDDQCGDTNKAGVVGAASFNANGDVTMNFTIVLAPGAAPVAVAAIVSPANGSGTWTDSAGNNGRFEFFGQTQGLPQRPRSASGLAPRSITGTDVNDSTLTGANVLDGSLTHADLADPPRAAFVGAAQQVQLTAGVSVVRSVSLTAPAPGRVVVVASAHGVANSTTAVDRGECSINLGTSFSAAIPRTSFGEIGGGTGAPAVLSFPLGLTWSFPVAAGQFTANLLCTAISGSVFVINPSMSAMYFPG
jgi:hypothetical protein